MHTAQWSVYWIWSRKNDDALLLRSRTWHSEVLEWQWFLLILIIIPVKCLYLSLHIYLKILEMLFNGLIYLSDFGMTWCLLPRSSLYSRVPPPLLGVPYCACATDPPGSPPPVFGSPITIHIISTKRLIGSRRNKGVCLRRQPPTVRPWAWGPWAACQPSLIIKSVKNALGKRVRHLRSNLSNLASFIISVYTSILL